MKDRCVALISLACGVAGMFLSACGGGGDSPGPCPDGYYEAIVGTEYDYTSAPMRVLPITACVPEGFDPWGHPLPKK